MTKEHFGIRLDSDLVVRVDEIAAALTARASGANVTRSEAARVALAKGVAALEKELGIADQKATKPKK